MTHNRTFVVRATASLFPSQFICPINPWRKTMKSRVLLHIAVMALGFSTAVPPARAESYPTRPIVLVSPFPAGGGVDVLCRHLAEKLRGSLGQSVIVENRSGGGGNVGAEAVARA